jgi:hypothetical protein
LEVDVRPVLPLIQAPTLVLHRRDYQFLSIEHGRFLAEHLPEAKLVELPGADGTLVWETPELALDLIEEFLTGVRRPVEASRVLATVLFTDIVGSTERAGRLGDRRWRELLDVHDARPISETSCAASDCKSGQACTPARSSSATVTLAASPCTSRPGSWPRLDPVRSSPPGPYGTWSWAPTSPWTIVDHSG